MKYFHPFLYLLLLIAPQAFSDSPTWYEVEILIFEHLAPNTHDLELVFLETRPLLSEQLEDRSSAQVQEAARLLPLSPRAWKLTDVAQNLNELSHYRTLLHQAWKQIAVTPPQASPVSLRLPFPENTPGELLAPQLEGSIILSRGRFLHLALDLLYRSPPSPVMFSSPLIPNAEVDPGGNASPYVRLTESRRIRIQELHYFDHPRFGVLAQIRQSTPPEANTQGGASVTFPLEATTSAAEIPPEEAGETLKPEE